MSWEQVSPELREIIERVCTPRQVEIYRHKANGHTLREIAAMLGLKSHGTVSSHMEAAERAIAQEVAAMRGIS